MRQVIAACQFVYEEKFIAKYNVHPLKVVGSEGIFGFIALILIQIPMYFIKDIGLELGYNPDHRLEDPLGKSVYKSFFYNSTIIAANLTIF